MRHSAWYTATLRQPEGAASTPGPGKAATPTNRLQRARSRRRLPDWQPDMPPVHPCAMPLIGWLFDAGPAMPGAAGAAPLTAQELQAWQHGQCLRLTPWQERTLRRLSRAYVAELHTAAAPDAPAPWQSDTTNGALTDAAFDLRAHMRALRSA